MSKTLNAIQKLTPKAKTFCEYSQKEIRKYTENGMREFTIQEVRKLRGYLQCLMDMEVITYTDMQALYIFYGTM